MTVTNIHSVSIIQVSTIASSDPPLQTPWTALFVGPITRNSNIIYIYISTWLYIYIYIYIYLSTWLFEKVASEDLPVLTGTTPKPRFYDSEQPPIHTEEKIKRRGEEGEEKRTPCTHNFYIG